MPTTTNIIDVISTPPLASLQQVLDTGGPYGPGSHTLTTFSTNGAFLLPAGSYAVSGTYGVIAVVNGTIPPAAGFQIGWHDPLAISDASYYYDAIGQVLVQHQLPITGAWVTAQLEWLHELQTFFYWTLSIGTPGRVGLYVAPNWHIDLYYLCVL